MQFDKTAYVIIASTLALLALVAFQVKWMMDSRQQIEEQFDQRVRMALCFAVDNLDKGKYKCEHEEGADCVPMEEVENGYTLSTGKRFNAEELEVALATALDFYHVDLEYQVEVYDAKVGCQLKAKSRYSCKLSPMAKDAPDRLAIIFPGKPAFIFGKMKFMLFSSMLILLFITTVFVYANYSLLKQKKISEIHKQFFNNLAHEFRTPLTNIRLATKMIGKRKPDVDPAKYLKVIDQETTKLNHQVERVLHLAKMENGEYTLQKDKICLAELLREVVSDMQLQIQSKNAQILLEIGEEDVAIIGDRFHLSNAFRNLVDNALKYSKGNPQIRIAISRSEDQVLLTFEDNGIGIKPQEQEYVFDRYFRVSTGNVHDAKGFGLGLSYVKTIVERHKGIIKVFSEWQKGTRFDLSLPVQSA